MGPEPKSCALLSIVKTLVSRLFHSQGIRPAAESLFDSGVLKMNAFSVWGQFDIVTLVKSIKFSLCFPIKHCYESVFSS